MNPIQDQEEIMSTQHTILVQGAVFYAYHGATPEQIKQGQRFIIDAEVSSDMSKACQDDSVEGIVNYPEIFKIIEDITTNERFNLMQKLALRIIEKIKSDFPDVSRISLSARKAMCPFYRDCKTVPGGGGFITDNGGCGVTLVRNF